MTLDFTEPKSMVRLLISDTGGADGTTFLFEDQEIEVFLRLEQNDIYMAASAALRTIAGNEAQILKVMTALEVETNGAALAKSLNELADKYEQKSEDSYEFDIAAMGVDLFSRRQLRADFLQQLEPGFEGAETE